ncbi:MAG: hypothetical protein WKF86_10640 [Acidimicrobiales bacterium]
MFILGQVGSGLYQLLLILHLVSVLVAFAPAVVHPLIAGRLAKDDQGVRMFSLASSANTRTVHLPALVAVGVLGFALVGVSDRTYRFTDPWIAISGLLWLAIAGVISALVLPGERGMATGEAGAEAKVRAGGGIATLLLIVVLCLMVVKPG